MFWLFLIKQSQAYYDGQPGPSYGYGTAGDEILFEVPTGSVIVSASVCFHKGRLFNQHCYTSGKDQPNLKYIHIGILSKNWSQGTTIPQNRNFMESIKFVTSDGQVHGPFGKIFQLVRFGPKGPDSWSWIQYLYIWVEQKHVRKIFIETCLEILF